MKKYRPRDAPVPGSSVSETHPGYWADCIKYERHIRSRWFRDYGYKFYGKQSDLMSSGSDPYLNWIHGHGEAEKGLEKTHGCISGPRWPPKGPIPQVRSDIRDEQEKSVLTAPIGWYNYDDNHSEGNVSGHRQAVGQGHGVKAQKMTYDYPTPGNTQKHHVVQDHVTSYSSSFGHHSVQFRNHNQIHAKKPTSANDFHLQIRNPPQSDEVVQTKHPEDLYKFKPSSSSFDSTDLKPGDVPMTPDGRVDLDKLSMQLDDCSWAELQRRIQSIPPIEVCPKCENRVGCTCVPRRREKIPEDPGNGPDDVLPPWPPQVWCGPSYSGLRVGTLGDIHRLRYRLSQDPNWKTPMNRMYDEMKAVNYSGDKSHASEHTYSCGACRTAREAARGTWFDEQLKRGNPFTTGDTQFKACDYMRKW